MSQFYTSAMLAERWGCPPNAVLKLVKIGALRAISVGKMLRFKEADVLEYESSDLGPLEKEENDVYVIRCNDFLKIGKAADVNKRVAQIQSSNPHQIEIIAVLTEGNGHKLERELHNRFSECRHRGEWFRCEGELEAWVSRGCE